MNYYKYKEKLYFNENEYNLLGAFSHTTFFTSSLYKAAYLISSRKFPLFLELILSSSPLNVQFWHANQRTALTEAFNCNQFFFISSFD